mgnify:CR=1 FL=1
MKMVHCLCTVITVVYHQTEALRAVLSTNPARLHHQMAQKRRMCFCCLRDLREPSAHLWDAQHVRRGLRADVFEHEAEIIFIHHRRRDLLRDDFVKYGGRGRVGFGKGLQVHESCEVNEVSFIYMYLICVRD